MWTPYEGIGDRVYFIYAQFQTKFQAYDALERYFSNGIISESERPYVARRKLLQWKAHRYCVMFPA